MTLLQIINSPTKIIVGRRARFVILTSSIMLPLVEEMSISRGQNYILAANTMVI